MNLRFVHFHPGSSWKVFRRGGPRQASLRQGSLSQSKGHGWRLRFVHSPPGQLGIVFRLGAQRLSDLGLCSVSLSAPRGDSEDEILLRSPTWNVSRQASPAYGWVGYAVFSQGVTVRGGSSVPHPTILVTGSIWLAPPWRVFLRHGALYCTKERRRCFLGFTSSAKIERSPARLHAARDQAVP